MLVILLLALWLFLNSLHSQAAVLHEMIRGSSCEHKRSIYLLFLGTQSPFGRMFHLFWVWQGFSSSWMFLFKSKRLSLISWTGKISLVAPSSMVALLNYVIALIIYHWLFAAIVSGSLGFFSQSEMLWRFSQTYGLDFAFSFLFPMLVICTIKALIVSSLFWWLLLHWFMVAFVTKYTRLGLAWSLAGNAFSFLKFLGCCLILSPVL